MDLQKMMQKYRKDGLNRELAEARVCQDVILYAISKSEYCSNITLKGGVVMQSLSQSNRRATRDIDLDFIHHSINDDSIREFINMLNYISGLKIEINGEIEKLRHQDYHGKSVKVRITDKNGISVGSKVDIGVHKHLELKQEMHYFEVCFDEKGVSLLKNSKEQAFVEKLRALLIFGVNDRRYKDIYDMYYLKDFIDSERLKKYIELLIIDDIQMRENSLIDVVKRLQIVFENKKFLKYISKSRQRWLDEDVENIVEGIINLVKNL